MGQQVQESQIANYRRRMQRESPASRMRSLFEQNEVLRQTFTVTVTRDVEVKTGQRGCAILSLDSASDNFVVRSEDGQIIGVIRGESGRVLAEILIKNQLSAVALIVVDVVPVVKDLRVQIAPE
jgi:hypothetical protein